MLKIILQSKRTITPFNEPARDLRVLNQPLWLAQFVFVGQRDCWRPAAFDLSNNLLQALLERQWRRCTKRQDAAQR